MRIVVLGLSITSSWGNGHATTYRALLRGLHERGHDVLFLERDKPWYRDNRDLTSSPFGHVALYDSLDELDAAHGRAVRDADLVMVGSYVPEGVAVIDWVQATARGITAFYDIDTPITMSKLEAHDEEYLSARVIPNFGIYFSFTGGPTLRRLEDEFGARMARPLYCSVDPSNYYPEPRPREFLMGYLGTYSADRQPWLERFLLSPARSMPGEPFAVAGPLYPEDISWPDNVIRIDHLPPREHRAFFNSQAFTLNVTRADMIKAGYSPSVRLFEAAACGTPILTDYWRGIEEFFTPDDEILIARTADEALRHLQQTTDAQRVAMGERARQRVLRNHTAVQRAIEIEGCVAECRSLLQPARKGHRA